MVGESVFELWLAPLRVRAWDGQRLVLDAPPQTQRWVHGRFGDLIRRCLQASLGPQLSVEIAPGDRSVPHAPTSPQAGEPQLDTTPAHPELNPRYTFEQFIIGDGNRLAHAAALAVAELPGQAYNPLFIHGGPGNGKTHLLHAIGNYVRAFGGASVVRYTTVEAFTNGFLASLGTRDASRHFKRLHRDVDVLLIDDVQFLANKARTEEEFFHTFNALHETGRQLVLTCDRLPQQLLNIQDRLRERFEAGLVAEISPPDLATRVAVLRKRAQLDGIELDDPQILEFIAACVPDNIRALEGALIRLVARQSLTGRHLDLQLARETLGDPGLPAAAPSFKRIQQVVAQRHRVAVERLLSDSRAAAAAWPRQLAIYLARQLTEASLAEIGAAFGGRNHATVVYACRRVAQRLEDNPVLAHEIAALRATILSAAKDDRTS